MHLNEYIFIIITNALAFSKLYYCTNFWCNTTEPKLNKFQAVQNLNFLAVSLVEQRRMPTYIFIYLFSDTVTPLKKGLLAGGSAKILF